MTHISPLGKKNNRSSLLSLENNYRHANGGAKLLTIRKLKSIYTLSISNGPCSLASGLRLSARFNKGVTEKSTESQF